MPDHFDLAVVQDLMENGPAILHTVLQERFSQDEKFGQDRILHPLEWFAILGEEVGEVGKEVVEHHFDPRDEYRLIYLDNMRIELKQVAAVCVAMIGSINRAERQLENYPRFPLSVGS